MSKEAIDRSVEEFGKMTDLQCVKHLANVRWGSFTKVTCPHCNTSSEHYWSEAEMRWKCKGCGKRFSVTSQTVFANRRMPMQKLLAALHLWACGAAGQPALELRRMLKFGGYNTAFTLVSKLREGLFRGFNTGMVSGVVEMDGAHASGRRASEKRGKPLNYRVTSEEDAQADALLTTSARQKKRRDEKAATLAAGGVVHPEHGAAFPASRRIVFTVRKRSGAKGRGAAVTRVGVGLMETPNVAEALAAAYVAIPESILATDTGTAFSALGKQFQVHIQVNHSETLVGPNGEHVNNSESFSARQDRSEKGVYLNIEPKHLVEYASETAFREDHRRMAPGAAADRALRWALSVGLSHYWRGYTHGKHRDHEILVTGNRPAKASGPAKGRSPVSSENGRPPR
jgi:ribosomal protein L37AE/L43A